MQPDNRIPKTTILSHADNSKNNRGLLYNGHRRSNNRHFSTASYTQGFYSLSERHLEKKMDYEQRALPPAAGKSAFRISRGSLYQPLHERNYSPAHGISGFGYQKMRSHHHAVQFRCHKQCRNMERCGAGLY